MYKTSHYTHTHSHYAHNNTFKKLAIMMGARTIHTEHAQYYVSHLQRKMYPSRTTIHALHIF